MNCCRRILFSLFLFFILPTYSMWVVVPSNKSEKTIECSEEELFSSENEIKENSQAGYQQKKRETIVIGGRPFFSISNYESKEKVHALVPVMESTLRFNFSSLKPKWDAITKKIDATGQDPLIKNDVRELGSKFFAIQESGLLALLTPSSILLFYDECIVRHPFKKKINADETDYFSIFTDTDFSMHSNGNVSCYYALWANATKVCVFLMSSKTKELTLWSEKEFSNAHQARIIKDLKKDGVAGVVWSSREKILVDKWMEPCSEYVLNGIQLDKHGKAQVEVLLNNG